MTASTVERRRQLLACAQAISAPAANRNIKPVHVSQVISDLEILRVLETVVRRWTKFVPATLSSPEAIGLPANQVDFDHVVPCRVLVDRMIMDPAECERLLTQAVVLARITKQQHRALGGIFLHHEALYGRLLTAHLSDLAALGRQCYGVPKISLLSIG